MCFVLKKFKTDASVYSLLEFWNYEESTDQLSLSELFQNLDIHHVDMEDNSKYDIINVQCERNFKFFHRILIFFENPSKMIRLSKIIKIDLGMLWECSKRFFIRPRACNLNFENSSTDRVKPFEHITSLRRLEIFHFYAQTSRKSSFFCLYASYSGWLSM